MAEDSKYNKKAADYAVSFIECLSHTKGTWAGKKFELLDWQEQIIRDLFGILKPNGYRQFNTAYIEIPKKNGKSELAAAVALLLTCGDEKIQRLHSGIAGAFGHNIEQLSVRLRMKLIKHNPMNVETMFAIGFCRKHLIKAVGREVHDTLL